MKKLALFLGLFLPLALIAQNSNEDSVQTTMSSKARYNIEMGATMSSGFGGRGFASTYVFPKAQMKINDKVSMRVGVLAGEAWTYGKKAPIDRAPYENRYKHNAATMAADYKINDKALLSVSAFFDMYSPYGSRINNSRELYTYGASASLWYKIGKNSLFNISVSYLQSNNPYTLMPYCHPWITPYYNNAVGNFLYGDDDNLLNFSANHNSITNW